MEKVEMQEMISALADGQLEGEAVSRVIQTVASDAQARSAWHTYHLIGDVLRSGGLPAGSAPAAFLARFRVRLESEQTAPAVPAAVASRTPQPSLDASQAAANDASFRWKLVAGFASLAAVAAVGWTVAGSFVRPEQAQLASTAPQSGVAADARTVMIRDPRLDELLAAHRQFGGGALQMPAGFLRNATFEGPAR